MNMSEINQTMINFENLNENNSRSLNNFNQKQNYNYNVILLNEN